MNQPPPYLYVRGLRQADHTVFCVADGQKTYYDQQFNQRVAFSSGQQVKRSIMDSLVEVLGEQRAPITFNYEVNKKEEIEYKEPWSPCDPRYADQLVGGWMRARPGEPTLKRRSPLSISAMRPLHPLLVAQSSENLTFDRSEHPERHPVRVLNAGGQEMTEVEINTFLDGKGRTLPRRHWIPDNVRTTGLFVYDVAMDLRRLFRVSTNRHDPEMKAEMVDALKADGWEEVDEGASLLAPADLREKIIPALTHALVNWRVTSNQSRTYSPQATLAIALSDNANRIVGAIRADLALDGDRPRAEPVVDTIPGVELFAALPALGYIRGVTASPDAIDQAEAHLIERLRAFDYEAMPAASF
jgi:hypothetical protein